MSTFYSPNQIMELAKNSMIGGREPSTYKDWMLIVNAIAYNLHPEVAQSAMKLFKVLYNIPLTEEEINFIVRKQIESKNKDKNNGWTYLCGDCWDQVHPDEYKPETSLGYDVCGRCGEQATLVYGSR